MTSRGFTYWLIVAAVCSVAATGPNAPAAEVSYIDVASGQSYARQQMATAAKFYGLEMEETVLTGRRDTASAVAAIGDPNIVAVVITANTLSALDQQQVLAALRKHGHRIPVLIVGVTEQTDSAVLRQWSAGAIAGCKTSAIAQGRGSYTVSSVTDITRQLSSHRFPLNQTDIRYMIMDARHGVQLLMAAKLDSVELPVFANVALGNQVLFFATETRADDIPVSPDPFREQAVFATLAPQLMFLRYAAGLRAWHSPASYANLTIDDAWLRERYGYVDYVKLLREAQGHNFHVTVAFVPWNFDRSEPAMISLFRTHPDRFSITVHGNNHDHQEFGLYKTHPLNKQVDDIRQALARMERFSELTHIPYSPVMVFPHSISPESTLAALKRYNFLATANSLNVPSDASAPPDEEFALRAVTQAFANFPSLRRYSAEVPIPESQLAIDAFIGNPMLFYVHQGFFAAGIDSFNRTADTVTELQPDVQWRSLGHIAQHLYLTKLRDDGAYDVRLYTGSTHLENTQKRESTFFIEKEEDFALPMDVLVDGQPYAYERVGTQVRLKLLVPGGKSREITFRYRNDLNLAAVDISKSSSRISIIRLLSDFRDNMVSRTALGRRFIRSYTGKSSEWNGIAVILTGLVVALGAWHLSKGRKSVSRVARRGVITVTGR
jgi:hypothetical protein